MRKKDPNILFLASAQDAKKLFEAINLRSKYLCGNCHQLRGGPSTGRPTSCGGCGSTNIDVEMDMMSQRLEIIRAGGPEAFEKLTRTGKLRD